VENSNDLPIDMSEQNYIASCTSNMYVVRSVYHNALNIRDGNAPNSSSKIDYRKESKFVSHKTFVGP
jgi:hypothetical protein